VVPITDAMKKGKEPLRTFGDLMQFYQQQTVAPEKNPPPVAPQRPTEPAAAQETPPIVAEPILNALAATEHVIQAPLPDTPFPAEHTIAGDVFSTSEEPSPVETSEGSEREGE
jgi:protein Tex